MKTAMPGWYPLETYTRRLTEQEWASELYLRVALRIAYRNSKEMAAKHGGPITLGNGQESPEETFIAVLSDQAPERKGRFIFDDEPNQNRDWPINTMTAFEAEFLAHLLRPYSNPEHISWAQQLVERPALHVEFLHSETRQRILADRTEAWDKISPETGLFCRDVLGARVPLMVDLNLDDDTLKTAFSVWLVGMRNQLGDKRKLPYGETDFQKWHDFKVLQVFDLDLWMEITGSHITDVNIGRTLWPDDDGNLGDFDRTDRLRKVTRQSINVNLFTVWECERLVQQVRLMNFARTIMGAV